MKTELTDEQKQELRVKVAEFCGWRKQEYTDPGDDRYIPIRHITRWKKGDNIAWKINDFPDYPNDLNACHEAEKLLTDGQHKQFREHLRDVVDASPCREHRRVISATATERALAFVRTMEGKV